MDRQKSVTLSPASSQHHSVADNIFLQTLPITSALTNQLQSATKVNNLSALDMQFRNDLLKTLLFPRENGNYFSPSFLVHTSWLCKRDFWSTVMVQ